MKREDPHTNQRPGSTQNRRPRNSAGNFSRYIGDLAGKSALQTGLHSPKKPLFRIPPLQKHPSFPTNYKAFYKTPPRHRRPPHHSSRSRRGVAGDDLVRSDLRCGPSGEGRVSMAKKWSNSDESYEARSSGSTDSEEEAKNAEIEQEDEEELEAVGKAVAGDGPGQDSSSTEDDGGAELGGDDDDDDDDDDDVR